MKFNKLVPELIVSDFKKSLEFYTKTLGFKKEYDREGFAFLSFQGSQLMIEKDNDNWKTNTLEYPFGRGINFQVEVKSVIPIIKSLKRKNYSLYKPAEDHWYKKGNKLFGCKEFLIQDPDGYLLRFSQNIGVKIATKQR